MANGISKNPLTDIGKVYLTQIAEGRLKSLEKASVLAMSDKPEDQDKAREIKTRYDYQSLMKQKKARKMKEDSDFTEARSDWRTDLREIIVTKDKDPEEPEIKEKKVKNKIQINPEFKEAVEKLGGKLLTVEEVSEDPKKEEQMRKKEKMLKKRMLMMKLRAVNQDAGGDVTAGYEPEGEMVEDIEMTRKAYNKIHKDFKSDNPKKPRTTKYVPGKGTVSMPVKFVDEATRYAKETGKSFKSGKPMVKGGTAKDDKAFQAVAKKYASQMMGGPQKKKVRGQKPDESNTPFKRAAERMKKIKMDNKALADKAKKAGYKSTQDYVNVQAVRKGGLGT